MTTKQLMPFLVLQVLVIGIIIMGGVLYSTVKQNAFLEVQVLASEQRVQDLTEHSIAMDKATAELAKATKSVDAINKDIRSTIRKAMKDEVYKIWHESTSPSNIPGLLREAAANYGIEVKSSTRSADDGQQTGGGNP